MTGRLPFEGDVLGDIVLKVCASPMPAPSKINPAVPNGFDAWFARACSRDPARRFQTAEELAQALAGVCGLGRTRMATLDEDQIQYVMRPKLEDADRFTSIPAPQPMSARTALLAGLVLGIAVMVGLLGFMAWHERSAAQSAQPQPAQSQLRPAKDAGVYAAMRRRSSTRISSKLGGCLPRARHKRKSAWWTSASSGAPWEPSSRARSTASAYAALSSSPFEWSRYATASSREMFSRLLMIGFLFILAPSLPLVRGPDPDSVKRARHMSG
jgi:hypothetical protein